MVFLIKTSSIAAGIRRIEAVTSSKAEQYINSKLSVLTSLAEILKNPKDPVKALYQIIKQKEELNNELELLEVEKLKELKNDLINKIEKRGWMMIGFSL